MIASGKVTNNVGKWSPTIISHVEMNVEEPMSKDPFPNETYNTCWVCRSPDPHCADNVIVSKNKDD
ncbi:hypothetical protein Csa_011968 [Cucumis sativus]|uniref:Uncharacterized protein n=1 Tax=Cucumis sativus TaxID=3659 RepID=A0A0A0L262_CUCSA|nr:hypothetical protein Csa_011968 [Cucumis sativus]